MKKIIPLLLLLISVGAYSQEYAKYKTTKKDTLVAKPQKVTKKAKKESVKELPIAQVVTEPIPKKRTGDFQATMERALMQSQAGNYKKAVEIYTEAQEISSEDQTWRAVVSRASTYSQMKEYDKAAVDYTWMIEDKLVPEKKKAYAYYMRAVMASETKTKEDDVRGCEDIKKAEEMGFPMMGKPKLDCK